MSLYEEQLMKSLSFYTLGLSAGLKQNGNMRFVKITKYWTVCTILGKPSTPSEASVNCFQYLDCLQNDLGHVLDSFTGNAFCQQRKYLNLSHFLNPLQFIHFPSSPAHSLSSYLIEYIVALIANKRKIGGSS